MTSTTWKWIDLEPSAHSKEYLDSIRGFSTKQDVRCMYKSTNLQFRRKAICELFSNDFPGVLPQVFWCFVHFLWWRALTLQRSEAINGCQSRKLTSWNLVEISWNKLYIPDSKSQKLLLEPVEKGHLSQIFRTSKKWGLNMWTPSGYQQVPQCDKVKHV